MDNVPGTVYLLHFDRPIGDPANPHAQAQHYIGWAANLNGRLAHHASGTGSRLMAAVSRAGIEWQVARTWEGETRNFERKLKNYHKTRQLCPICSGHVSKLRTKPKPTEVHDDIPF